AGRTPETRQDNVTSTPGRPRGPKLSPIRLPRKRRLNTLTLLNEQQIVLGVGRRDLRPCLPHMDIDLTPHTEPPREVDPGLHREAHAGDQGPLVRGLEVVQ